MAEDFPQELETACKNFESAMITVEKTLAPLLDTERSQLVRGKSSLDTAKLDLLAIYSMNSFYWAYLVLEGVDPKSHSIKQELGRIQTYMAKVEEIKNRKNAPKLVKDAAKRFVRNALFDAEQKKGEQKSVCDENKQADTELSNEQNDDITNKNESKVEQKKKKMKRKSEKDKKVKKRPKKSAQS